MKCGGVDINKKEAMKGFRECAAEGKSKITEEERRRRRSPEEQQNNGNKREWPQQSMV